MPKNVSNDTDMILNVNVMTEQNVSVCCSVAEVTFVETISTCSRINILALRQRWLWRLLFVNSARLVIHDRVGIFHKNRRNQAVP